MGNATLTQSTTAAGTAAGKRTARAKVFCFFFSKKKAFPSYSALSRSLEYFL